MGVRIGCPGTVEKAWMDSTFREDDSSSTRESRSSSQENQMSLIKLLGCLPKEPDSKCQNCRRYGLLSDSYVTCTNSKDRACIYIPISLQAKI
jgi:hypothetical protein